VQTPSRGVYFEHYQNKRSRRLHSAHTALLATAQRAPRRSAILRTLWERCQDATMVGQGFKEAVSRLRS